MFCIFLDPNDYGGGCFQTILLSKAILLDIFKQNIQYVVPQIKEGFKYPRYEDLHYFLFITISRE